MVAWLAPGTPMSTEGSGKSDVLPEATAGTAKEKTSAITRIIMYSFLSIANPLIVHTFPICCHAFHMDSFVNRTVCVQMLDNTHHYVTIVKEGA